MTRGRDLLAWFEARDRDALDLLRALVAIDSPTSDKAAVDRLSSTVASAFEAAGARTRRIPQDRAGDALAVDLGGPAAGGAPGSVRPALLLGHLDTVWPLGEAGRRPLVVEEGWARGPGVFDMKAGIVLCVLLARAIRDGALRPALPVSCFFRGDEETGSPVSRGALEAAARSSAFVLGLEPCNPDGGAKTSRKGVGRIRIEAIGRAAHAGIDPEQGVNAIEELADQILALKMLEGSAPGATVHAGLVRGGVAKNVVAPDASAEIDVRVPTAAAWASIERAALTLKPRDPRARLRVEAALTHPPMERTPASARLFEKARAAAREVGFELGEGSTGGGSDGSHCAALGVPVLDGLGVEGEGAHAVGERVRVDRIAPRAAFLGRLLEIAGGA